MRVGVDVMGGDYAPEAAVMGVLEVSKLVSENTVVVMFGCKEAIDEILSKRSVSLPNNIEIVNTTEVIEMTDSPTQAFTKKKDSSIVVGFNYLHDKKIDAFASAGSTGAMMVGCMYTVKQIDGIIRPTIAAPLPTLKGQVLLLDVGLNVDCKPEVLYQYGIVGSIYSKVMMGISDPRISLLNIGEEDEKGNIQTKATYNLMKETSEFNFVGNLESKYIFEGTKADVIVCDGFIGNTILKMAEGLYNIFDNCASEEKVEFYNGLNYEVHGGTPVLGVNDVVIIGHGCSSPFAISNMILQAERAVKVGLVQKIKEAFC